MNLKKHIKLKQEYSNDVPYCEENEENRQKYEALYMQVQANQSACAVKRRENLWKVITPVFLGVIALIIILTFVLLPKKPDGVFYNEEKIKSIQSTFDDMQANTKYFNLQFSDGDAVNLYYDTISSDKLYYKFKIEFELNSVELVVKINKNYKYGFELKDEILNRNLSEYSVTYNKTANRYNTQINYRGYIEQSEEVVYFDYIQSPALGDEAFFKSIQQIVQLKK